MSTFASTTPRERSSPIPNFPSTDGNASITESTLAILRQNPTTNYVEITEDGQNQNRSSYSFISNESGVAIGVLNLSYVDDDSLSAMELQNFLSRLMQVYLFILGVAIILAYVVSRFITKSLEEISDKITQTALGTANQKIDLNPPGKELSKLINAYNDMVDQLAESAVRLAKSEREQAWREMAKQVAHEIKNPLTPMRLSVQSFEQQFDPRFFGIQKNRRVFIYTNPSNRYAEYHCLCLFQFCRNACTRVRIIGCGQNHPAWHGYFYGEIHRF